jgi:uncharacterized protein (DUF58 family)
MVLPIPTSRAVIAVATPAAVGILALFAPGAAYAMVAVAAAAMAVLITDLFRRPALLAAARAVPDPMTFGSVYEIALTIENREGRAIDIEILDDLPDGLAIEERTEYAPFNQVRRRLRLDAGGSKETRYAVTAARRGESRVEPLWARARSRYGFWIWPMRLGEARTVRVLPAVGNSGEEPLLADARLVEIMGARRSRRRGAGHDFESLREFEPGDDLRRVDWKATARRGRPITREYQTDRNHDIILAIDCGRLMGTQVEREERRELSADYADSGDSGSELKYKKSAKSEKSADNYLFGRRARTVAKIDIAVNAALAAAKTALRYGDRVGLLAFGAEVRVYVAPRPGPGQLGAILSAAAGVAAEQGDSSLGRASAYLQSRHPRRSLVILYTDFISAEASEHALRHAAALARRHRLIVAGIRDPYLRRTLAGALDAPDAVYRRLVARQIDAERRAFIGALAAAGVDALDLEPESVTLPVIDRYLEMVMSRAV